MLLQRCEWTSRFVNTKFNYESIQSELVNLLHTQYEFVNTKSRIVSKDRVYDYEKFEFVDMQA